MAFDIFGGGGGDTDVKYIDPWQGTGMREIYKQLNEWIGPQIGQGVTPYSGQIVPGASNLQEQGFGAAGGLTPLATGGMDVLSQALSQYDPTQGGQFMEMGQQGLSDIMQPFDPTSTQEAWSANMRPAFNMWRDEVVPAIQEKGVAMTGTGDAGGIGREISRSGKDLATNWSAILSNALYGGEQAHKGRQQTGVNQAMGYAQLPGQLLNQAGGMAGMGTDLLSQLLNIGGAQRGIEGEQMQEPYAKWQFSQPWANPYLQNFLGTTLSQPGMDYYTTQGGPGGSQFLPDLGSMTANADGGFLGGEGGTGGGGILGDSSPTGSTGSDIQLAMQIAAMFSDARVKENIVPIENALDKIDELTGSMFDYKGLKGARTGGVMAQDLEKVLPEAVTEVKGVKCVNMNAVIALLVNAVKELKVRGN